MKAAIPSPIPEAPLVTIATFPSIFLPDTIVSTPGNGPNGHLFSPTSNAHPRERSTALFQPS
jgi:hypothetical protein